ncbi:MAG: DNA adenine methylase [Promethearchaeota archaeon]|nr:MAG: DNA adenine methylase [Candidatus Lokiarchaeota archaeon]
MKISEISFSKSKNTQNQVPYPFLKWAGGKRQLISQMKKFFPKKFNNYIEPFVGGGAVFFELYKKDLIKNGAILIDNNKELINCYRVIKDKVEELIESLCKHKNEKEYYYKIRELDRNPKIYNKISDVEKASRNVFLNKCCYNGLYRVNSKGQFNVPFGRYKNPNYCDVENLRAVSVSLKNVKIIHDSFETCLNYAEQGDFIYFDPPYHPLSATSSFTSYTKEDFGVNYQKKLYNVYRELDNCGCKLMLSNSYSNFILDLYKDYKKVELKAKRSINSDATKRGEIKEILILNIYK